MKYFEDRLALLASLPKHMVMAELGVFEGTFSREIVKICEPAELHLIDRWRRSRSPDSTHLKVKRLKRIGMWRAKRAIQKEYKGDSRVNVHRGLTTKVMATFEDDYFDFVYIDADHHFDGVKLDLDMCFRKVKDGGYICGHDYQQIIDGKDTERYKGLRRAVDEFCESNGLTLEALTQPGDSLTDRSLSYCIVNRK